MRLSISEITEVGVFSALAFAGGYLFIGIPNVEIVTAIIFLSGILLGPRSGALVGLIAQTLFSTLNPYGISPPPLFVVQVANRVLTGYIGGRLQQYVLVGQSMKKIAGIFGITGFLLTLLYDLTTDASAMVISGFSFEQLKLIFILGSGWYVIHGIGNVLIFTLALPLIVKFMLQVEWFSGRTGN